MAESEKLENENQLNKAKLNEATKQRWVMGQFFSPSWTKNKTLVELRNEQNKSLFENFDSTDYELAREILFRAGLGESFRLVELTHLFAEALGQIEDPRTFMNPNAGVNEKKQEEKKTESVQNDGETKAVKVEAKSTSTPKVSK